MKIIFLSAAFLLSSMSCQKEVKEFPPLTKDEITGQRLWERITSETDFDGYPEWPGYEGLRPGQSPHGQYHEIYINPVLRNALPIAASPPTPK